MLEIPAHPKAFREDVQGTLRRPGILVSKTDLAVYPITHGLHPCPSRRNPAKQFQCNRRKPVHFAIPAVVEIAQSFMRQFLDWNFPRGQVHRIQEAYVIELRRTAQAQRAWLSYEPGTAIPKTI